MPNEIPGVKQPESLPPNDSSGVKEGSASPAEDVKTAAESSTEAKEDKGVKPASLLDAIRNATGDEPAAGESPASETPSKAAPAAETGDTSTEDQSSEEEIKPDADGRVPYERFKLKNDECNALRVKALEYDQVEQFMQRYDLDAADVAQFYQHAISCKSAGVTTEEMAKAVEIAVALKLDPERALELLEPHYRAARLFTGDELPEDLQQKVDSDLISRDDAKEIASQRSKLALKEQQEEERRRQWEQQEEQIERVSSETEQLQARDALLNNLRTRDPDFVAKEDAIFERALFLARNGHPAGTPEEVRHVFQQAYDDITARFKKIRGHKQSVTTLTSDGTATVRAKPEPKTLREAIANA